VKDNLGGALWRLAIFVTACLLAMFAMFAIFAQLRFQNERTFSAEFTNVSSLKVDDFVRIAGVEVGKVKEIHLKPDTTAVVKFSADDTVVLTEGTRAVIRYADLIGGRYLGRWARQLLADKLEKLIAQTRRECSGKSQADAVEKELGYFVNNIDRMQYGTFRRQGFFIGSGVVEAGCKTVIGSRCKQSGMFWGEAGAENILALRCIHASHRLDEFWKHRLNSHAARNDRLPLAA